MVTNLYLNMNQDLNKYVSGQRAAGVADTEIKAVLEKAGWGASEIVEVMSASAGVVASGVVASGAPVAMAAGTASTIAVATSASTAPWIVGTVVGLAVIGGGTYYADSTGIIDVP